MVVVRWLRWERAQFPAHWRVDLRRGFPIGAWLGGVFAAWLALA